MENINVYCSYHYILITVIVFLLVVIYISNGVIEVFLIVKLF